ncbi:MAG: hypothetical protein HYW01_12805 [Deltaproteobacteria bacterium]|nr:hypothetical protein [Deltaproteobacteria bacterium]
MYSTKLLLSFLMILYSAVSSAGTIDQALVGKWYTEIGGSEPGRKISLLWQINTTGESTMSTISSEAGFLLTSPESWAVRHPDSPYDLSHGKYSVTDSSSFSIVIAGMPYEWIKWTRILSGSKPSGVDDCVVSAVMTEPKASSPQAEFNSAPIGLWQASMTKDGNPIDMVWRISPNGQSTFIAVQAIKVSTETNNGKLKTTATHGSPAGEISYRLLNKDQFEVSDGYETIKWTRCGTGGGTKSE